MNRTNATLGFLLGSLALGLGVLACSSDDTGNASTPTTPDASTPVITPPVVTDDAGTTPTVDGGPDSGSAARTTGTGTYETNLTDFPFTVADVAARYLTSSKTGGGYEAKLDIWLHSQAGYCAARTANVNFKNSKRIHLQVQKDCAVELGCSYGPGTYTFGETATEEIEFERDLYNETCMDPRTTDLPVAIDPEKTTVSVANIVITTLSATRVTGSYELRNVAGDFIKGTFDSELCNVPSATTAATCK